jgi:hypothetical protein
MTATPPWKNKNPKKSGSSQKMSEEQKEEARERAKNAGRPYPNLVDNMAVLKNSKR